MCDILSKINLILFVDSYFIITIMVNVIKIKIVKDSRSFKSILTDLIKTLSKIHCVDFNHKQKQTKESNEQKTNNV